MTYARELSELAAAVTVDGSKNIGIGASSPVGKFSVKAGTNSIYSVTESTNLYLDSLNGSATGWSQVNNRATVFTWMTDPSTTPVERMRINASGNVSIGGTSSASATGFTFVNAFGSNGGAFEVYSGSTRQGQYYCDSGSLYLGALTNIPLVFNTNNTERMRIDSYGNVGIGTNNPAGFSSLLAVRSDSGVCASFNSINTNGARVNFQNIGIDSFAIGMPATTGALAFYSSGTTERMRIDSSGNVIIGTTAASGKFNVYGGLNFFSYTQNGTSEVLKLNNDATAAGVNAVKLSFSSSGVTKGSITTAVYGNGYMAFATNDDTEKMRIDASGNVGIGTTNPIYKVDVQVAGSTIVQAKNTFNAADAQFRAVNTGGLSLFGRDGSGTYIWENGSYPIQFFTNATERMRIDPSGYVGMGTSIPSSYAGRLNVVAGYLALGSSGIDGGLVKSISFQSETYGLTYQNNIQSSISSNLAYSTLQFNLASGANTTSTAMTLQGKNIVLAGGTSTTGTGITFPATQDASSGVNTLDDYEEGTWTPTITASGYTFAYGIQSGAYTKVGNVVYIKMYLTTNATPSGSGTVAGFISGLPFASANSAASYGSWSICPESGGSFFSRTCAIRGFPASTQAIIFNGWGGSTTQTTFNWSTINNFEWEISGFYFVA